jgi:hypothetical protein
MVPSDQSTFALWRGLSKSKVLPAQILTVNRPRGYKKIWRYPDEIDGSRMIGGGGPHGVGVAGDRVVHRQGRHQFANNRCKRFDCRFSAPRSQGNCVSSRAMASAVAGRSAARRGTETALGGEIRARRARWLRPKARPPRAPRRRSCIGDLLKRPGG